MNKVINLVSVVLALPLTILAFLFGVSRTQLVLLFMVSGIVWVPIGQIQMMRDPVRSMANLANIGIGSYNLYKDVEGVKKRVVPLEWRKMGKRYHAEAWVDNVSFEKPKPLHSKIGGALVAPFKWVGGMFI